MIQPPLNRLNHEIGLQSFKDRYANRPVWILGRDPSLLTWQPSFFSGKPVIAVNSAIRFLCLPGMPGEPHWYRLGFDWQPFIDQTKAALPCGVRHVAPMSWIQRQWPASEPWMPETFARVPWTFFHSQPFVGQEPQEISGLEPPTILAAIMLALRAGAREINLAGVRFRPANWPTHFDCQSPEPDRIAEDAVQRKRLFDSRIIPYCRQFGIILKRWIDHKACVQYGGLRIRRVLAKE